MPEASQHVEEAGMMLHIGEAGEFNMAYLFFFVGYVAILICERVLSVDDVESGGGLGKVYQAFPLSGRSCLIHPSARPVNIFMG